MSALKKVVEALERVGAAPRAHSNGARLTARCPAHGDRSPSLSITMAEGGRVLVHCFAGCEFRSILNALELTPGDLRGCGVNPSTDPTRAVRRSPAELAQERAIEAEVLALWSVSPRVTADVQVEEWLRSRAVEPHLVEAFDLARALTRSRALPEWAALGWRTWNELDYRLLVALYDASGRLRSLRARRIAPAADEFPKALAPLGLRFGGLVMADPLARRMLAGELLDPLDLVVAEGEPDFLTWATQFSDADEDAPGVVGIAAGSWADSVAARVPDRSRVVLWVDHDHAGDRYAEHVARSLGSRCEVLRSTSEGGRPCAT